MNGQFYQSQGYQNQGNIMGRNAVSTKSKTVAALLCFFFGYLGIHRFYVGKAGTGLLWLFTGGCFAIGNFIDFFRIIFGNFTDSDGARLK